MLVGSHCVLLTAGSNGKGQLGIGSYDDAHRFIPCQFAGCREPNQLPDPTATVAHVACGANHTALLLRHLDGSTTLWGTGDGGKGQLGPEHPRTRPDAGPNPEAAPVPWTIFCELIVGPQGCTCKHVAAAWETTYVVLARSGSSDVLLSMGSNAFGALGIGDVNDEGGGAPRVVTFDHIFLDEAGSIAQHRTIYIRSLHAGPRHVVAQLVVTHTVVGAGADMSEPPPRSRTILVGWGASRHGQLGQNGGVCFFSRPTRLPIDVEDDPMVSCALGSQHTVVLHASGRISALGSNRQGQIPLLDGRRRVYGLGCTWNGTYMQAIDGNRHVLLSTGSNSHGQLGRESSVDEGTVSLPIDRAVSNVACGSEHVLATTTGPNEGNLVVGWGWNEHGNMGLGSTSNVAVPTQLWPREDVDAYSRYPQGVINVWAGCATSWLLVEGYPKVR